ncbi:unnamed protein product [Pylaiella littoralis]
MLRRVAKVSTILRHAHHGRLWGRGCCLCRVFFSRANASSHFERKPSLIRSAERDMDGRVSRGVRFG